MTKRKYRTDEEWLSLIQECRLSGLTDKQWCEAHQICPSNFYYQIQKFRKRACEIPESHSKTTLTAQKQEVVQVTFEQPAVSEHPQSCLSKDTKADAAILVQINGFQIGITNAASESAIFHTLSALHRLRHPVPVLGKKKMYKSEKTNNYKGLCIRHTFVKKE